MTEEFPNNSNRAGKKPKDVPPDVPPEVEQHIEKIIQGTATIRKPSGFKRFRRSFIAGDASSVSEHILWNLVIPSAKDAMSDMLTTFVDMMIYGEKRTRVGGPGSSPARGPGSTSQMNYGAISSGHNRVVLNPPSQMMDQAPRVHPNEIYLSTRAEADVVILKMFDVLEKYKVVTIADLYGWIGVSPNPLDYKRGWTNLDAADIQRTRHGVHLNLPTPEDLS